MAYVLLAVGGLKNNRIEVATSVSAYLKKALKKIISKAYLPDGEVKPDQRGVSSRVRLLHCTTLGLTPAITTNVGNSTVQFLVVGACVRARSLLDDEKIEPELHFTLSRLEYLISNT